MILSQLYFCMLIITLLLPYKGLEATHIYVCFNLDSLVDDLGFTLEIRNKNVILYI